MTTLRDRLTPPISALITSRFRRDLTRNVEGLRRRLSGSAPTVRYFHQVDDPYSQLAVQMLAPLMARYRIALQIHLVPAPDDAAAPERERLRAYGLRDAARLAEVYGLAFPPDARLPGAETIMLAARRLAVDLSPEAFAALAPQVGAELWSGRNLDPTGAAPEGAAQAALAQGEAERLRLGHYLGGMFQFEGEWYWGVDRLNHLEERLAALGLDRTPEAPKLAPYLTMRLDRTAAPGPAPVIEFWFSFRSPYVSIAFPRVRTLARHYGAELRLRPILPMIMRGLPVPPTKTRYIMLDTKREAERSAMPYGRMIEPVGAPTERCMAVLWRAMALGKGEAFGELALQSIFAHGRNPAEDAVLFDLGRRAGLTDDDVRAGLADDSWRAAAEENRQALFDAGLWGAPSYRVNGQPAHWGQDRLRMLEDDIP
ncbi:DsbA family protein [Phenylobacterium aquaticum]|uniref:DsbA family protein n=1 Tax=Phenylobacterium aquaticum TaxID=1763816 RepID=UPI0026F125D5|nr:DsbA family protein [Phenylobacterium aquaticum]